MSDIWRPAWLSDSSTGVDDTSGAIPGIAMEKTFTVPTDRLWHIRCLLATAVSSAAVGNRSIVFQVQRGTSDTDPVVDVRTTVTQAASLTYYYMLGANMTQMGAVSDTDWMSMTIPDLVLPAGAIIRVFDEAAIGTTAAPDDLDIQMLVEWVGLKSS